MNYFTATDKSGIDYCHYRVIEQTSSGSRLLARCETAADARRIVTALGGTNTIQAASDTDVLARIDSALQLIETIQGHKSPAPKADKIRVVL